MNDIAELTIKIDALQATQADVALDKLSKTGKQVSESAAKFTADLEKQAKTLGMSALAVKIYEAEQQKLNSSQLASVKSSLESMAAYEQQQKQMEEVRKIATAMALAVTAVSAAMVVGVQSAIKLQDQYVRLSEIAGTTASKLSSFDLPARLSGTSLDTVAMSVARLSKSLGEAQLGDVQKMGMFKALGINPKDGRDAADVMIDVAKALTGMKDQNVAAAASVSLLQRGFAELRPFMKEITEQGELHARVTDDQARAAKSFEDNLTKLNFRLEETKIKLANDLLPILEQILAEFNKMGSTGGNVINDTIVAGLQVVATIGSDVVFMFKTAGIEIGVWAAQLTKLAQGDLKGFHLLSEDWTAEAQRMRKDLDDFQARINGVKAATGTAGPRASQADVRKTEPVESGSGEAERRVRELMEFNKNYDARVAAAKGYYEKYSEAIKTGNVLVQEAHKQGLISEEDMLKQIGANEDAKLRTLIESLKKQKDLASRKGDLGKTSELVSAIELANAQIVANEAITQAKITSLREQSDLEYKRGVATRVAALIEENLTELDQLQQTYTQKQNIIDAAAQEGFITDDQWQAMSAENFYKYEKAKTEIHDQEVMKRYNIAKVYRELDLNSAKTFFGYMSVLMNTKSREMFEIGKAAAIGQALINTYQSATGAYAALSGIPYVGPFLGAAAAAAAIVAGLANVAAIKSQSFGGSGGGATPTFAASPTTGQPVNAGTPDAGQERRTGPATVVHLHGDLFTGQQIRDLFEKINEASRDGARVEIA